MEWDTDTHCYAIRGGLMELLSVFDNHIFWFYCIRGSHILSIYLGGGFLILDLNWSMRVRI